MLGFGREEEGAEGLGDVVWANDVRLEDREEVRRREILDPALTQADRCIDDDAFQGRGVFLELDYGILEAGKTVSNRPRAVGGTR